MSYHPARLNGHSHFGSEVNEFKLSRDLVRPRDQSFMEFYEWEPLMVIHHPAKFGGHRHSGSGDIVFLVAKEENSRCCCFNPPLLFKFMEDMG